MKVSLSLLWQKSFGGNVVSKFLYGLAFFNALCCGMCVAAGAWGLAAFNLFLMVWNCFAAEATNERKDR